MPRLIDADKLTEYKASGFSDLTEWQQGWNDALDTVISEVPTVDVVKVVRCKDCRFALPSNEMCELLVTRLHFYETGRRWTEDSYCAWGERREDAEIN